MAKTLRFQGRIPPSDIANLLAPIGDSIYFGPSWRSLDLDSQQAILERVTRAVAHLMNSRDERILGLHGALLVENALDALLADARPYHPEMHRNSDFTFSPKISLGRALASLAICPRRLFQSAGVVRKVRNEFAHNLDTKSFSQVSAHHQAARQHPLEFLPSYPLAANDTEMFCELFLQTTFGIGAYRLSVQLLVRMLRDGDDSLYNVLSVFYGKTSGASCLIVPPGCAMDAPGEPTPFATQGVPLCHDVVR